MKLHLGTWGYLMNQKETKLAQLRWRASLRRNKTPANPNLNTPDDSSVKPFFEEATSLVPSKLSLVKFPQKFLLQQILHKYL